MCYKLLETGEKIKEGDEFYSPSIDKWLKHSSDLVGIKFNYETIHPTRREM